MMIAILLFLIPLLQSQASANDNEVKTLLNRPFSNQIYFPRHQLKLGTQKVVTLTSPSKLKFKVVCEEYEVDDPKMKIYTEDGVHIETATVFADNPCDETNVKSFVMPQEADNDLLVVIYRWASKTATCAKRKYLVTRQNMAAVVVNSDYPVVNCPANTYQSDFGVVDLVLRSRILVLDFTKDLANAGTSTTLDFPKTDFKGKRFMFVCKQDRLNSGLDLNTGSIVHEDHDRVSLEKFEMTTCGVENINVNRQIRNGVDHFKIVYKSAEGPCFQKEYKYLNDHSYFHYNIFRHQMMEVEKVPCPKSFVGDIDQNAARGWFAWLRKPSPYGREVTIPVLEEKMKKKTK